MGVQIEMFDRIRFQKLSSFERSSFYDKINIALNNSDSQALSSYSLLLSILKSILDIILISSFISSIKPELLIIIGLQVSGSLLINMKKKKLSYAEGIEKAKEKRERSYVSRAYYLKDKIKEILSSDVHEVLNQRYEKCTDQIINTCRRYGKPLFSLSLVQAFIQQATSIGISAYLCVLVISDKMLLGNYVAGINAAVKISAAVGTLFENVPKLYENSLFVSYFRNFILDTSVVDNENTASLEALRKPDDCLLFNDVSYVYPLERTPAVDHISIRINKGEMVGLIGENGAGKSTLAALATGILLPDSGSIILNYNSRVLSSTDPFWYKNVCAIFQDASIFEASIAENILMRKIKSQADYITVNNALNKVGMIELVNALPQQLNTIMTSEICNGKSFSGGEIKKLVLARVFASNAPVVILDEAFVSLDNLSKECIWDELKKNLRQKISIIITHDYKYNNEFDSIIVIRKGCIVTCGQHNDLHSKNAYYAKLVYGHEDSNQKKED